MEMMLGLAMRVMDTEGDKVADMVLKIPDDDFTDVTVVMLMIVFWRLGVESNKTNLVLWVKHWNRVNQHQAQIFVT